MHFSPPLTMMDFFRASEGVWYTQRSVHHFDLVADQSGESRLQVQVIGKDDPRCQEICASQGIDPAWAMGGAGFLWQPHEENHSPDPDRAAILIDVPDAYSPGSGKLLRNQGYVEKIPVMSRYWFGKDGILTIETEYETNQGQERCWFLTEDFRVRVSTVRMLGGVYLMTYCSERRLLGEKDLQTLAENHLEE